MNRNMMMLPAIAALWASGCGTICNLKSEDPKMPFGGVQADLERDLFPNSGGKAAIGALALRCADMTLSAVGDTLTFPFALYLIKVKGYAFPDAAETANPPPSSGNVYSTAIVEQ